MSTFSAKEINYEAATRIFDMVASGMTLEHIFREDGLPSARLFYAWLRLSPELKKEYEAAQEEFAERIVYEMLDLVDAVDEDNSVSVQACRLKTDVRKWMASRMASRKFGDKQQVDMNANIKTDYESILEAARRRSESSSQQPE